MHTYATLAIVQPYLPRYRVPFFAELKSRLSADYIDVQVVAGRPLGSQAARGDDTDADWATRFEPRQLKFAGRAITLAHTRRHWAHADGVILPLMGTSLDAYSAILHKGPRVGLWGHVDSYVARANPLDQALERWMVRRADQVFAYTTRGANLARRWGAAQTSVTSVMNTVDTKELETSLRDLECSPSPVRAKPITLGYIGGLDGTKRISLLAQALMALTMRGTSVKLVVGGQGPDAHLLDALRTSHDIDIRGYVSGVDKAKLLQEVDALVCPGRIGLVAVDALVAQKPILTTDYEFHAPEADYLKDGISMFSSPDSAEAYADLIESQPWRRSIPPADWQYPRIETMVENFRLGVLRMMNLEA